MRTNYARHSTETPGATLDDLLEAVATLEDLERAARRVMGGARSLRRLSTIWGSRGCAPRPRDTVGGGASVPGGRT